MDFRDLMREISGPQLPPDVPLAETYLTGAAMPLEDATADPGLFRDPDGTVWLRHPDTSESRVAGVGASGTFTRSVTITTDPNTFSAFSSFNLGHPATIYAKVTLLGVVPDGETFGAAGGNLYALVSFPISGDGLDVVVGGSALVIRANALLAANNYRDYVVLVPGFVTVRIEIYHQGGGLYAGANHPTVTARIELTYV